MDYKNVLNVRLLSINKSPTLRLTSLAKQLKAEGKDIVNFSAGEPDFDTPRFIKDAAKAALDKGITKYTPSTGLFELKEAIARKFNSENRISYSAENIIVTSGAKFAVFLAISSLVNDDEEVIIPSPYWVSYPEMVKLARGKIKILPTRKENNFKIIPADLKSAINKKSKILILNYPVNPTGITYTRDELEAIWKVIEESNIFVLSDEIYEKILFDDREHISFASLAGALQRTITINGFSKSHSMTGWRIGFMAGPREIIREVSRIVDNTTSCPNSLAQMAAIGALNNNKEWFEFIKNTFQERRDLIYNGLRECKKIVPLKPQGTFYQFCGISDTNLSSFEFSSRILNEQLVAIIPSEGFGIEKYLRISFAVSRENIEKGIARIKKFGSNL